MTESRAKRIIDAGPGINFFQSHNERILTGVLGVLHAPESVVAEIKSGAAGRVLAGVKGKWVIPLSDDYTPELNAAVKVVTSMPLSEWKSPSSRRGGDRVGLCGGP